MAEAREAERPNKEEPHTRMDIKDKEIKLKARRR